MNCKWCVWNIPKRTGKETWTDGNQSTMETIQTIKIGQNTEKSAADLRRLAVTQIPLRNHQLMLVSKTLKVVIIICKKSSSKISKEFVLDNEMLKILLDF